MKKELLIDSITSPSPVQAEGTIGGNKFYFRARWDTWSFAVSENPEIDPVLVDSPEKGFYIEEKYGNNSYEAGYMPLEKVNSILEHCADLYLNNRN